MVQWVRRSWFKSQIGRGRAFRIPAGSSARFTRRAAASDAPASPDVHAFSFDRAPRSSTTLPSAGTPAAARRRRLALAVASMRTSRPGPAARRSSTRPARRRAPALAEQRSRPASRAASRRTSAALLTTALGLTGSSCSARRRRSARGRLRSTPGAVQRALRFARRRREPSRTGAGAISACRRAARA